GGEPTVRAHLPVLVAKLAALEVDLAMTTNGSVLSTLAPALREAGLGRVNISLDSLRRERFAALT
ncbi:MAG TPA: radical SAM protein, partial [Acidimicrobiales bacterium]|nr:radical SAM protein [Acidimicrobiales bacterium]